MSDSRIVKPTRGRALLIVGIVLLVLGMVGFVLFGFGTPGPNTALNNAVWETGLIVGASFAIGVGVLLILIAIVRRTRRRAIKSQPQQTPRGPDSEA